MTSLKHANHVSDQGTPVLGGVRRWRAFSLLAVAYFMTIMDLTIVNVALPTIGRKLHFAQSDLQWVVTAYALTFGGFLLFGGRAADLLGRRRLFMAGLGVFTAASLGCALATSDTFLIIMRGIQGLGGALMAASSLAIITSTFDPGPARNRAVALWGSMNGAGGAAGTFFGGLITEDLSWRWVLLSARRRPSASRAVAAIRSTSFFLSPLCGTESATLRPPSESASATKPCSMSVWLSKTIGGFGRLS